LKISPPCRINALMTSWSNPASTPVVIPSMICNGVCCKPSAADGCEGWPISAISGRPQCALAWGLNLAAYT
jgi:hypothetical protein